MRLTFQREYAALRALRLLKRFNKETKRCSEGVSRRYVKTPLQFLGIALFQSQTPISMLQYMLHYRKSKALSYSRASTARKGKKIHYFQLHIAQAFPLQLVQGSQVAPHSNAPAVGLTESQFSHRLLFNIPRFLRLIQRTLTSLYEKVLTLIFCQRGCRCSQDNDLSPDIASSVSQFLHEHP